MRTFRVLVAMLVGLTLSACAGNNFASIDNLRRDQGKPRILMMPPDVQLTELTMAGVHELNAAWTKQAQAHMDKAIADHLTEHKAVFVRYVPPAEDHEDYRLFHQLQKLHGTVGETIRAFHLVEARRLPAKRGKFDWSLGPAAARLGQTGEADYALFVHVRDSYSSGARVALQVVAVLAFGVPVPGGVQTGHASLVDLRTGEVVWTNFLARGSGDLREAVPAKESVAALLENLPK